MPVKIKQQLRQKLEVLGVKVLVGGHTSIKHKGLEPKSVDTILEKKISKTKKISNFFR